jgi:hypothetical protein
MKLHPMRRVNDRWLLSRSRLTGVLLFASGMAAITIPAFADGMATTIAHEVSGVIMLIAGSVLALVHDDRCTPKLTKVNELLMRSLAKKLGVRYQDDKKGDG